MSRRPSAPTPKRSEASPFQLGVAAMNRRADDEAMAHFQRAIQLRQRVPEAYNGLGVLYQRQNQPEKAKTAFEQALAANPNHTTARFNLGQLCQSLGLLDEACRHLRAGLRQNPDNPKYWTKLGQLLNQLKQPEAAEEAYHRAVAQEPDNPAAWAALGEWSLDRKDAPNTERCYREVLRLNPNNVVALNNLGWALQHQGRLPEALSVLEGAVEAHPIVPTLWRILGETYRKAERPAMALACLRNALALAPHQAENDYQLGYFFYNQGDFAAAADAFLSALAKNPDYADAQNMLGNARVKLGDLHGALTAFDTAIRLNPKEASYASNRAIAYRNLGRYEEALASFRDAVAIDPDYAEAHFGIGMVQLLRGEFEEGWREYDWRRRTSGFCGLRTVPIPEWRGEPLAGRRIFVHSEQGFGDTLQFVRYLPLLQALGPEEVVLSVDTHLTTLLNGIAGADSLVSMTSPPPGMDVHVHLLSLPGLLGTRLETIPAETPYLMADPERVARWAQRLADTAGKPRVGLVWRGRPTYVNDEIRSAGVRHYETLIDQFPDIQFVALQFGKAAEELDTLPNAHRVLNLGREIQDFTDTAAILQNLDLLISTDTSAVHLAGALGRPVWTLLCYDPDWRWLIGRSDCPWYPLMRLFRQPVLGDWGSVIQDVGEALSAWRP